MELDLNVPRSEAAPEDHTLIVGDEHFELPPELPIDLMDLLQDGRVGAALRLLLGDRYDDASAAAGGFSMQDLGRIVNHFYGLAVGESSASDSSSGSGGTSSRPTSSASTASTSRKRSGTPTLVDAAASDVS